MNLNFDYLYKLKSLKMFDVRWLLIALMFASAALPCEGNEKNPLLIPDSDDDVPGVGPIRRTEWFRGVWKNRRSSWLVEKNIADKGSIVFLGDSITQGWGEDFKGLFGNLKVVNRGISGDTSRGLF